MSNLRFLKYLCFLPGQTTALLVPWTKIPDDMNMSVYSIERNQKLTCSDPPFCDYVICVWMFPNRFYQ